MMYRLATILICFNITNVNSAVVDPEVWNGEG